MEFTMPDNSKRKVYMQPSSCYMIVIDKQIITSCEMAVDNKPIKQNAVIVQSSTLNENKVTISNEPVKEKETKKKKRKKNKTVEEEKK
jgi:Na+-translocating ferredoxin:NAD+ oxidoreductase RNF subunit RnfB